MTDTTTTDLTPYPEAAPDAQIDVGRGLPTLAEMTRSLQAEKTALRDAAARIETATAAHEAAIRHAHNFSDEARVVFEREAAAALAATEQAVAQAASDALDVTRAVTRQLPEDRMVVDPATEALAVGRSVILGQVIQTAPLGQLRDELKGAIVAGDTATAYVMTALLPARLAAPPPPNEAGRPEVGEARREIAALLATARASLRDPAADPVRALVGEVRAQAAAVARPAEARRQQAALDADIQSGRRVAWPAADPLAIRVS